MSTVILQTNSFAWYTDNGNAKEYIPQGINVYYHNSGNPYFTNVYKSAICIDLANSHPEICLVSDESFSYSDAFGQWYGAREESGY